jgi:hypothetical protein
MCARENGKRVDQYKYTDYLHSSKLYDGGGKIKYHTPRLASPDSGSGGAKGGS